MPFWIGYPGLSIKQYKNNNKLKLLDNVLENFYLRGNSIENR